MLKEKGPLRKKHLRTGIMAAALTASSVLGISAYALSPTHAFDESDLCVTATRVDDPKLSSMKCSKEADTDLVLPSPSPTQSETSSPEPSATLSPAPTVTPAPTPTAPPEPTVGAVGSISSLTPSSTGLPAGIWTDFSTSSDGKRLVGLRGTYYLTSNDSGATWTQIASGGSNWNWSILASGEDSVQSYIFPSNASTVTSNKNYFWKANTFQGSLNAIEIGDTTAGYSAAAASASGSRVIALNVSNTKVWVSSNSGTSWTARGSFPYSNWTDATSSSDGSKLAITSSYSGGQTLGYVYLSKDSGTTWTKVDALGGKRWNSIDSSADGQTIVATAYIGGGAYPSSGGIYVSKDGGSTWTEQTVLGTATGWSTVAVSGDGQKIAVGQNTAAGKLFTSTDGSATWNTSTIYGAGRWAKIEMSSSGNKIYAVRDGQLYAGDL